MSKKFIKTVALICAVCLMTAAMTGFAAADETDTADLAVPPYTDVQIYVDGLLACRGYMIEEATHVTLRSMCNAVGQRINLVLGTEVDAQGNETTVMTAQVDGVDITYTQGDEYMCANGRYIYIPGGAYELEGELVFPVDALAGIFGLVTEVDELTGAVKLDTAEMQLLESGETYYNEDDVYWLSHIIHAESGNQPLEGMIGVGAVVMNRVADPVFPDNIKDVIFSPGQFEPVASGSINLTPNELAVVAAYLSLEGCNTVEDSVFFYNPGSGTSYLSSATFVVRIEDHVFSSR